MIFISYAVLAIFVALVLGLLWGINRLVTGSAKSAAIRLAERQAERLKNLPPDPDGNLKRKRSKTRLKIMIGTVASCLIAFGIFSFIEKRNEEKCSMDFSVVNQGDKISVYFGGNEVYKTDSSSIKADSYFGVSKNIVLINELSSKVDKDGIVYNVAGKYRIVYKDGDCNFHATPLFGNNNEPVISYDDDNIHLYFKSGNNYLAGLKGDGVDLHFKTEDDPPDQGDTQSDPVYGAGYYRVDTSPWRFDKLEVSPEMAVVLDDFEDYSE